MTETRARVRRHVTANPGVHFNAVTREVGIATGQTQYHLRRLLRAGALTREEVCGRTHYFPPEFTERERTTIALLRRESAGAFLLELLARGEASPAALAADLDLARSTIEWHVSTLQDADLVEKRYREGGVSIRLRRPGEVAGVLESVAPSLAERFDHPVDGRLE